MFQGTNMSNRVVVSQTLREIANKLDDQGLHDVADQVTEDLMRVASGGNIRTAFLKKLFRGVGKAFRNPAFQALALQQLQKYLNRPKKPGQAPISPNAQDVLTAPTASPTVSVPPSLSTGQPRLTPTQLATYDEAEVAADEKAKEYFKQLLEKAKNPNLPIQNKNLVLQQAYQAGYYQKYPELFKELYNAIYSPVSPPKPPKKQIQPAQENPNQGVVSPISTATFRPTVNPTPNVPK